jgi:hypothetical protein
VHRRDGEKTHGERSEDAARDILSADRHFALSFRTSVIALARVSLPAAVARRRLAYVLTATQRRLRRLRRNRECGPIAGIPSLHRCIVNDGAILDRDLA